MRTTLARHAPSYKPELIKAMKNFGDFSNDVNPDNIQAEARLLHDNGLIKTLPDPEDYIWQGGRA